MSVKLLVAPGVLAQGMLASPGLVGTCSCSNALVKLANYYVVSMSCQVLWANYHIVGKLRRALSHVNYASCVVVLGQRAVTTRGGQGPTDFRSLKTCQLECARVGVLVKHGVKPCFECCSTTNTFVKTRGCLGKRCKHDKGNSRCDITLLD